MSSLRWTILVSLILAPQGSAQDLQVVERARATFDINGPHDNARFPKGVERSLLPPQGAVDPTAAGGLTQQLQLGGPSNDDCADAIVISSNTYTYNNSQSTFTATSETCEGQEACAGGFNVGWSVWYEYTPLQNGRVQASTLGSNYDTILSAYTACGFQAGIFCSQPGSFACNDNYFFGTTSLISFEVVAGTTYRFKISGRNGGGTLNFNLEYFPPNDTCDNATQITTMGFDPSLPLPTLNAGIDPCEALEDCEFNNLGTSRSVWYSFLAPCDGLINLNTNGSDYDTVLSVFDGCGVFNGVDNPCGVPTSIACDDDSGTGLGSQLEDVPVIGGLEYLIKVAGYGTDSDGGLLDFNFYFEGASPPQADLVSFGNFECVCQNVVIQGTAASGTDSFVLWSLDVQPLGGGAWTPIADGQTPVNGGVLASWPTAGLSEGYYTVRLQVENACGVANSATRVVFVSTEFQEPELRRPMNQAVHGGLLCIDGTTNDTCFSQYVVELRPTGGSFAPIGAGTYSTAVVNDPLVPENWDTASVPDGTYELRVTGTDQCGNDESAVATFEIDNTPPIAEITSPDACDRLDGTVQIRGSVSDANLLDWKLQYTGGSQDSWVTIAQGSNAVSNGVLGTWDTSSLPRCGYTLRLTAFDRSQIDCDDLQRTTDMVSVEVGECVIRVAPSPVPGS